MGEWQVTRIGEVAKIFDGPHATPRTVDHGPIYLGIDSLAGGRLELNDPRHVTEEDYRMWTRRVTPRAGDVVFSYETRIGEAAIIPKGLRCCLGRRMGLVRADPAKLDPRFFLYQYLSPKFQEFLRSRTVHGSTVDRILLTEFPDFEVYLPALAEQRVIASILGALDDKIELNRRMKETLEALARAIFKSWFVDFDPVHAKAEGRKPFGMDDATATLFPSCLTNSELGAIPNGWEVASLPELIDVNPSRSLRKGDIAPYLDMANMPIRGHAPDEVVERRFGSGMRFINGDTLVARITPCLENGKTAFVDFLQDGQVGWGSTEYIVLRPKPPLPEEFAYCLARSEGFRDFAIQSMTGSSGRQRVPAESLAHFQLVH